METKTITIAEVKRGTVSQEEIDNIIRGEDLIEVNNTDLANLFGIKALRRKIMWTMTPAFHDSDITTRFIGAIIFAIGTGALATLTSANIALSVAIIGWIACAVMSIITAFAIFNDSSNSVKDTLKFTGGMAIGATIAGVSAFYAGKIIPQTVIDNVDSGITIWWSIATAVTAACFIGLAIYLYSTFEDFAKSAVDLSTDWDSIGGDNSEEKRRKMLDSWCDHQIKRGNSIPDAVRYNLLAHGIDPIYRRVEFVKPHLDLRKYSDEKERQKLARDPAIILRDHNDRRFLVGAWDIKGDAEQIIAEAKKQTKEVVRSVASRISAASKRDILNTIKKNMTKTQ